MKVLFLGTQPITSPRQEKQNESVPSQNSYSSHPQQKEVFSKTYPPNYNNNIHFGMDQTSWWHLFHWNKNYIMDITENLFKQDQDKYKTLKLGALGHFAETLHGSRMELEKVSQSEYAENNPEANDCRELVSLASNNIYKIKKHVENGNIPENPIQKKRNDLLELIGKREKEYQKLIKPPAPSGTSSEITGDSVKQKSNPIVTSDPVKQRFDPIVTSDPVKQKSDPIVTGGPVKQRFDPARNI